LCAHLIAPRVAHPHGVLRAIPDTKWLVVNVCTIGVRTAIVHRVLLHRRHVVGVHRIVPVTKVHQAVPLVSLSMVHVPVTKAIGHGVFVHHVLPTVRCVRFRMYVRNVSLITHCRVVNVADYVHTVAAVVVVPLVVVVGANLTTPVSMEPLMVLLDSRPMANVPRGPMIGRGLPAHAQQAHVKRTLAPIVPHWAVVVGANRLALVSKVVPVVPLLVRVLVIIGPGLAPTVIHQTRLSPQLHGS